MMRNVDALSFLTPNACCHRLYIELMLPACSPEQRIPSSMGVITVLWDQRESSSVAVYIHVHAPHMTPICQRPLRANHACTLSVYVNVDDVQSTAVTQARFAKKSSEQRTKE